jgi:hypothetical protein
MKTNIPRQILRLALLVSLAAAPLARADDEGSTATVKLSAPDKPATLKLDMPWADIHIVGVDGDTVTVESSLTQKSSKPTRAGALRRLDNEVSFELSEKDNVVTVALAGENPWGGHDAEFKISVPKGIALDITTEAGGDLQVQGVEGDINIQNVNGEVKLDGLVGGAIINTANGEVRAAYAKVPQKPVSIASMNGEIRLYVPADTKANVRMSTQNGSILTDFSEDVLKTKAENSKGSSSYSYGHNEAVRAAAEAARAAAEVSRTVAREVHREVARAVRDRDDDNVTPGTPATPATAPTPSPTPRVPRMPRIPMPPITGGKVVTGTLNGGGVDIKVSTMNGEITLRQTK